MLERLAGDMVTDARAAVVAPAAGAIAARLHAMPADGLPSRRPIILLAVAAVAVRRTATFAPDVERRATALLAHLELTMPATPHVVTSHGDLVASQFCTMPDGLALLDFDEAGAAAPAHDLASFAANRVSGRPGDMDDALRVLDAICEGYGRRPAALEWHLAVAILRRVDTAFRNQKKDWPERTEPDRGRGRAGPRADDGGGMIAVVTSGFPRRSETFVLNELLALDARGALAAVFATKPGDGSPLQPGAERLVSRVQVLPAGSAEEQGALVAERLRGRGVRAVHGHFAHEPAAVARSAARRLGVPFGFSTHARDARKVERGELADRARAAACVVACNADVATELETAGADVRLLPHGVDLERFRPAAERHAGPIRLLAVGRLVPKKGFDVLLEACLHLVTPFELRIAGDGPELPALRALAAPLGDRVTFVGALTHHELPAEYAACDVVVAPSVVDAAGDRDGLPNVVLEALASGRPVVAADAGALATAVDASVGALVPQRDAAALAAAIDALASDSDRRRACGRTARRRAEFQFGLDACADRFLAELERAYV